MRTSGVQQSDSVIYIHIHVWKWKSLSRVRLCGRHGLQSPRSSPGQNTGVSSCSLLQGIFPTQGSNPGLPHCRRILYQLSHQGSTLSKNLFKPLCHRLSIDHNEGAALLHTKRQPRSRSSTNGLHVCIYSILYTFSI